MIHRLKAFNELASNPKLFTFLYVVLEALLRLNFTIEDMTKMAKLLKEIDNERERKRATQGKT